MSKCKTVPKARAIRFAALSALLSTAALSNACSAPGERPEQPAEPPEQLTQAVVAASNRPLSSNRDRLLDLYAARLASQGKLTSPNRCSAWDAMNDVKRKVFLTLTHNLSLAPTSRRSADYRVSSSGEANAQFCYNWGIHAGDPCYSCYQIPQGPSPVGTGCTSPGSVDECVSYGLCYATYDERRGYQYDSMLDHVDNVWAVLDGSYGFLANQSPIGLCGGGDNNRMFFSLDQFGIDTLRNQESTNNMSEGGVLWKASGDLAGPHSPFNDSLDTSRGQPRPQVHHWNTDANAVYLANRHPDVQDVNDPHTVEMDIDYNWLHDSNPACSSYFADYRSVWASNGWPSLEESYKPSGCDGTTLLAVQDAFTWSTDSTKTGSYVALWGTFGSGNTAHFVQPSGPTTVGYFQDIAVAPSYESTNQINVPVPTSLASSLLRGAVYIYLVDNQLRRTEAVPIYVQ